MPELLDTECRAKMPVWAVSRLYLRPDGSFFSRPIGKWKAWTRDDAIRKAAFAIKRLALLSAKRMLLALCACALPSTAKAATYSELFVIGDSLSMENSGAPLPNLYWGNGTSNGPMWPEYLAGLLGIEFSADDDVAVGSAATFPLTDDDGSALPGLEDQIASLPPGDKSSALIVLWLGTNDLQLVFSGYPATETISQAIANIQEGIESLYALGFKAMIVPNVFDLTQTPGYRSLNTAAELRAQRILIKDFNAQLATAVGVEQQLHPDAKIVTVNVFTKWRHVLAYPANYGIAYPFSTGMDDPDFIATTDFTIGDVYGSWDGVHPTTTIHQLLATWFKKALR